jgi:hypothetical protein
VWILIFNIDLTIKPTTMNPLKIVLTFTFVVFITIGLLANHNTISSIETNEQVITEKPSKVSADQAVSLFNFFKIEALNNDSSATKSIISESKLKVLYDYFIFYTKPVFK